MHGHQPRGKGQGASRGNKQKKTKKRECGRVAPANRRIIEITPAPGACWDYLRPARRPSRAVNEEQFNNHKFILPV
ncbi:hypothetical protein AG1IA_04399 [Rhizoctonia solani AG-1 IA]|uniref:Uncharacterized protein n=1 Tax=Thanatephorus cucumeris (strain AG1-IA) TaxID=983506 RepID=L8WU86_THACA|nr:hypothetical protein AG1IA_04399 [Rhizoctonia solani AG-1 IA]